MAWAWIGEGSSYPTSDTAAISGPGNPSEAKSVICSDMMRPVAVARAINI